MKFSTFNIDKNLVDFLSSKGYKELSSIQEKAIPSLLANKSSFVKAPTGSGKTFCYLVPILNDLDLAKSCQAIIIVPTTLLVDQLYITFRRFSEYKNFKIDVIKDGTSKNVESYNGHIIIATPNMFLLNYSKFNLKDLKRLVIDEGDMLIFDGFEDQLVQILTLDLKGSKSLFTASVNEHLNTLVKKYIQAEKLIEVNQGQITSSNVTHYFVDIKAKDKVDALITFLKIKKPYKAIVFVSKKNEIDSISEKLNNNGIKHLSISGNLSKREQNRILKLFSTDNNYNLLLGSDLISRGFDVEDVSDVISLDLPYDLTYYFHRAGRTGRFDKKGNSYVFYSEADLEKPRELAKKNLNFKYLTLKEDSLKEERSLSDKANRPKINNLLLEQEIKKSIYKNKLRSKKVKPNYKKKIKVAIERTKQKHKEDLIKKNISKRNETEGTTFTYYKEDNYIKNKKKQAQKYKKSKNK
jgi:ATP-dependent RNA helicase CshB